MPLVVAEAHRPYWQYQVHDLAAGDVIPDGEFADYLRATGSPVVEESGNTPDVTGDGVPDGTAVDVLGWVGDDPARAALALLAEQKREKPRTTLVANLEKVAQKGVPNGQPED